MQQIQEGIVLMHRLCGKGGKCRSPTEVPPSARADLKRKQARWERLSVEKCFAWFSTSHSFMGERQQESKSSPPLSPPTLSGSPSGLRWEKVPAGTF